MTDKVVSMEDRRTRNRYYYSTGYAYLREASKFLTGALLVSAAPFLYSVVTNDFVAFAVFEVFAAAGAGAGAVSFLTDASDRGEPLVPAGRIPRMPSVARRGLKKVA